MGAALWSLKTNRRSATPCKPFRPGSITSRTIKSNVRLLARKHPSSPIIYSFFHSGLHLRALQRGLISQSEVLSLKRVWFMNDERW